MAAPTDDPAEIEARLAMPLAEAMATQRAIRRLSDAPVADVLVRRLLELAQRAPSGGGRQPQRYVVVRDRAVKEGLGELNRTGWRRIRARYDRAELTPSQRRTVAAADWQAERFADAPVVVVVCLAGRLWPWPPLLASVLYGSVYPSVQNLLLAARAVGLGANVTTLPVAPRRRARRVLGLPRRVQPVCAVPLGWPLGRYGPTTRAPIERLTHLDRYGRRMGGEGGPAPPEGTNAFGGL